MAIKWWKSRKSKYNLANSFPLRLSTDPVPHSLVHTLVIPKFVPWLEQFKVLTGIVHSSGILTHFSKGTTDVYDYKVNPYKWSKLIMQQDLII